MISAGKSCHIVLLPIAKKTAPASSAHRVLAIIKINAPRVWFDRVVPMPIKSHQISAHLSNPPLFLSGHPKKSNSHVLAFCNESSSNTHKYLITGIT